MFGSVGTSANPLYVKCLYCSFWDIVTGLKWVGYLKPKVREVILESPTIQFYEKLNLFCTLPDDKMLKYTPIINAKLADTKKLRDRYLGYLEDAATQSKINMGEVLALNYII
ncbi:unnamed protein product [Medioppia subpectinata]|uniref:Uncharacterized protein n=1 Tax=Medioppia subpectinata TaxID=1979941 RepID=A0A7R9Q3C6_9ACAR|nr:unnamed protein product [Medioppia subpectinata]CAG2111264.1 unnamed protein product [Medioppia subpectinata]